jgi:hypothetical protein
MVAALHASQRPIAWPVDSLAGKGVGADNSESASEQRRAGEALAPPLYAKQRIDLGRRG